MLSNLIRNSTEWRRLGGFRDLNGGVDEATRNSEGQVAANKVRCAETEPRIATAKFTAYFSTNIYLSLQLFVAFV